MRSVVPDVLAAAVNSTPAGSLTLVTSVIDASASWLLLRFVHGAINGSEAVSSGSNGRRVILVSILRGLEQWQETGKKIVSSNQLIDPSQSH